MVFIFRLQHITQFNSAMTMTKCSIHPEIDFYFKIIFQQAY